LFPVKNLEIDSKSGGGVLQKLDSLTPWARLLGWTCIALWFGILIIGLWPFNFFPTNRTRWIQSLNGLHFDAYGQTYSRQSWVLNNSGVTGDLSFTIELWLGAADARHPQESTFFSIFGDSSDSDLSIAQSRSDLLLGAYFRGRNGTQQGQLRFYNVCSSSHPVFVTITSSQEGTVFYEGAKQQARYPVAPVRYTGRVVLGHAPDGNNSWTGDILGLAVYDHAITSGEIAQHYGIWRSQKPWLLQSARALYTFDERTGDVVHNRTGPAPDLIIPANFKPLNLTVLAVPHPFRFRRIDTVVNVLGFMPFGFLLCAYLQDGKHYSRKKAFVGTIMLGAVTSLSIELLQVFLPSRDSSLLDVVNNIAGTTLAAFVQVSIDEFWRSAGLCLIQRRPTSSGR
jgi:VanZ family protein